MHRKVFIIVLAIALWPLCSEALTREDFLVDSTQDLVKLCAASESEPLYQAAIGFCHGYVVGVYHYYQATTVGAGQTGFVCSLIRGPRGRRPYRCSWRGRSRIHNI